MSSENLSFLQPLRRGYSTFCSKSQGKSLSFCVVVWLFCLRLPSFAFSPSFALLLLLISLLVLLCLGSVCVMNDEGDLCCVFFIGRFACSTDLKVELWLPPVFVYSSSSFSSLLCAMLFNRYIYVSPLCCMIRRCLQERSSSDTRGESTPTLPTISQSSRLFRKTLLRWQMVSREHLFAALCIPREVWLDALPRNMCPLEVPHTAYSPAILTLHFFFLNYSRGANLVASNISRGIFALSLELSHAVCSVRIVTLLL